MVKCVCLALRVERKILAIVDNVILIAFTRENKTNNNGGKSRHHVVIIDLKVGEDLYLKSLINGTKQGHMRDIYFTLFKICCDSSIKI